VSTGWLSLARVAAVTTSRSMVTKASRPRPSAAEGTKVAKNEMQIGTVLRLGYEGRHRTTPHIRNNFSIYLIRRERLLESRFRSV
jgi:hypothetical protein